MLRTRFNSDSTITRVMKEESKEIQDPPHHISCAVNRSSGWPSHFRGEWRLLSDPRCRDEAIAAGGCCDVEELNVGVGKRISIISY